MSFLFVQMYFFKRNWLSILLICNRHVFTAVIHIIIVIIVTSTTVTYGRRH